MNLDGVFEIAQLNQSHLKLYLCPKKKQGHTKINLNEKVRET